MRHRFARAWRRQNGGVTVVVAVFATAMLGLVAMGTDVGLLYVAQQRVSTVADAAALSGAQLLPEQPLEAVETVQEYLEKNGVQPRDVTVTMNEADRTMRVEVRAYVRFTFARVLGFEGTEVRAGAVARVSAVSGYDNVVPLGVVQADWKLGDLVTLKATPGSGGTLSPGNYGPLALGGSGASTYETNLLYGYEGWTRSGEWLRTETGNMAGPTARAMQQRLAQDPFAEFTAVDRDSPRMMILPILESFAVNGRGEVQCVGFAAFFLEAVAESGNDRGSITGRFLRYVVTGESDGSAADFKAYTIKLTH